MYPDAQSGACPWGTDSVNLSPQMSRAECGLSAGYETLKRRKEKETEPSMLNFVSKMPYQVSNLSFS